MRKTTREWLSRAKDDLDVIAEIINKQHLANMVAFHAQQAIEKSLKAIVYQKIPIVMLFLFSALPAENKKIYKLRALCELCEK